MKRLLLGASLCLFLAFGCKDNKTSAPVTIAEVAFKKQGELKLIQKETDSILQTLDIEIADTEYKTQTGLMYRSSMDDHQSMLFIFPDSQVRSFYMKNTQIALDIIFINSNKEIVSFQKNAQPFDERSLPSNVPSQYVLEINAGLSDAWGLQTGDRIEFTRID
jgi:uncharacterized membrane protein (UPF0127 family)